MKNRVQLAPFGCLFFSCFRFSQELTSGCLRVHAHGEREVHVLPAASRGLPEGGDRRQPADLPDARSEGQVQSSSQGERQKQCRSRAEACLLTSECLLLNLIHFDAMTCSGSTLRACFLGTGAVEFFLHSAARLRARREGEGRAGCVGGRRGVNQVLLYRNPRAITMLPAALSIRKVCADLRDSREVDGRRPSLRPEARL